MRVPRIRQLVVGWAALAAFLAPTPPRLDAQTIPSPYRFLDGTHTVGLVVGTIAAKRGELNTGPGGGTLVGVRYGLELRGPLALDVHGFFASSDRQVFVPVAGTGLIPLGSAGTSLAGLDARLRFTVTGRRTWHWIAPYVALGGGLAGELSGPSAIEQEVDPAARVGFGPSFVAVGGAGIRIIPTARIELRAEANLRIWKLGTPVGFRDIEEDLDEPLPEQQWLGPGAVALGMSYRF